ncbi:MAG: carboxypeptidase-like regulatory domain-containing protein [Bacteroidota bacterium]
MKRIPAFLFYGLLSSLTVFSQQTIKGNVVAISNGMPVPGSSVFISNTSKGTTADKNGYFEINDVPFGKHELIVSSIGYETNVFSFSSEKLPLKLRVEMEVKVKELQNVIVEPSVEEGWEKWGKVFLDNFVGRTSNGLRCKIKNEKAIKFRYYRKSNRVIAYADEPIILENKALGYKISYQLEDFEVNFNTKATLFSGYPLFEEIDKGRKGLQQRWGKSRDKAYYGSMLHFMYSLFHDSLQHQGFEVRRMVRVPNTEKERVKKLYRSGFIVRSAGLTGMSIKIGNADTSNTLPADSLDYYERVMRQEDYKEIYGRELLTADSLVLETDGNYKSIFFTDYLYITYKNEIEEEGYLEAHGEKRTRTFQRSYITLLNQKAFAIDMNGNYYPPQDVFAMAYWGWSEKMADFLPIDYKPSKD